MKREDLVLKIQNNTKKCNDNLESADYPKFKRELEQSILDLKAFDEINKNQAENNQEIERLKQEVETQKTKVSDLETQKQSLEEELSQSKTDLQTEKDREVVNKEDFDNLSTEKSQLEGQLKNYKDFIESENTTEAFTAFKDSGGSKEKKEPGDKENPISEAERLVLEKAAATKAIKEAFEKRNAKK